MEKNLIKIPDFLSDILFKTYVYKMIIYIYIYNWIYTYITEYIHITESLCYIPKTNTAL